MIAATLLVSLLATVQGASTPGRALFWASKRGEGVPEYRSQSSTLSDVRSLLLDSIDQRDLVVTFCSQEEATNDFFATPHFSSSIRGSEGAIIMPNVYHSREVEAASASFCDMARDGQTAVTVSSVLDSLSSSPAARNFFINLEAPSEEYTAQVQSLLNKLQEMNALIVGLQEPQVSAPSARGRYARLLQEEEEETNYNPEGTEFTIYYKNTYLYLTPDLFTGLMTFLFCTFVLLTGFSCLNQIQGPSTFVHNMPTLGKEG